MIRFALSLVVALLFVGTVVAQDTDGQDEEEAQKAAAAAAAEQWLAVVDSAGWMQSHREAAELFKKTVSAETWIQQIRAARTPLGRFISRTLTGSTYATELPGAPKGEYVVLTFSAAFENKPNAVETVTPMKDPDGEWRVSGYYVR